MKPDLRSQEKATKEDIKSYIRHTKNIKGDKNVQRKNECE